MLLSKPCPCRKWPFSFTTAEAEHFLPGETFATHCHEGGAHCFFNWIFSSLINKCLFFWRLTPKGRCLLWSLWKASNNRAVFSTVIVGDRMSRVFRKLASEQKSHFITLSSACLCVHVWQMCFIYYSQVTNAEVLTSFLGVRGTGKRGEAQKTHYLSL